MNRDLLSLCTTHSGDLQEQWAVRAGQGTEEFTDSPGVLWHKGKGALKVAQGSVQAAAFGRRQDMAREGHIKKLSLA